MREQESGGQEIRPTEPQKRRSEHFLAEMQRVQKREAVVQLFLLMAASSSVNFLTTIKLTLTSL